MQLVDSRLPPSRARARDYFKPGGQFEKDNPGIRHRLHDAEIDRRANEEIRRMSTQRGDLVSAPRIINDPSVGGGPRAEPGGATR